MNKAGSTSIIGILSGPTASGKSSLALEVALRHDLAIISADSMQVYRGMTIGTGALRPGERRGVPHHLIGIADPGEDFHAARFAGAAREAAAMEWRNHGRRSLVAGGTGLWIQALREGLFDGPGRDETLRARLRGRLAREGAEALHAELSRADPAMAEKLSPRDHVRVLRALEVFELTGKPLSVWYAEDAARRQALGSLLPLVVLNPPLEELRPRIFKRVEEMLAEGWLEEARRLHELNLPGHAPAKKALGYRDLFRVIEGKTDLESATEKIKTSTAQYARRQRTWFRSQREVHFLESATVEAVERALGLE